jgi:sec-independent protein translocase protein TatA
MVVGALEVLLVLLVVLLVIGPRRIADLGRSLGRGVRDFKLEFGRKEKDRELGDDPESGREKDLHRQGQR